MEASGYLPGIPPLTIVFLLLMIITMIHWVTVISEARMGASVSKPGWAVGSKTDLYSWLVLYASWSQEGNF
jgi:hypothetical protein